MCEDDKLNETDLDVVACIGDSMLGVQLRTGLTHPQVLDSMERSLCVITQYRDNLIAQDVGSLAEQQMSVMAARLLDGTLAWLQSHTAGVLHHTSRQPVAN